jgi:carbon-monoxide dehydrogenase medium subunit
MIPTSFDYVRAGSLKETLNLLATGDGTKVIAGGHSLLPLMKFRLVQTPRLVDISRIEELRGIAEYKKGVRIGATTTYADIAASPVVRERCPVVAEVAGNIADLQVRNRGTLGGALAHADPASDMPALMLALDADFELRSKKAGKRSVKAREFFKGPFATAMTEDELFTGIVLGGMGRNAAAYVSFEQAASGYAMVGVCAVVARKRTTISAITVAFTGLGEVQFLSQAFEQLVETKGDRATLEKAALEAVKGLEIAGDLHAPSDYRRHLAQVTAIRAVQKAYERAGA